MKITPVSKMMSEYPLPHKTFPYFVGVISLTIKLFRLWMYCFTDKPAQNFPVVAICIFSMADTFIISWPRLITTFNLTDDLTMLEYSAGQQDKLVRPHPLQWNLQFSSYLDSQIHET